MIMPMSCRIIIDAVSTKVLEVLIKGIQSYYHPLNSIVL